MVEGNLLVVKTNDRQRIDRYDIFQVYRELASMLKHSDRITYMVKPVPRELVADTWTV